MSHLFIVETPLHDPHVLRATCQQLGLPAPLLSVWRLAGDSFVGFLLSLPGWEQPVLLDTLTGLLRAVVPPGESGLEQALASFLNACACQKTRRDAHLTPAPAV